MTTKYSSSRSCVPESVKVKPGSPWRPQVVRDPRAMGHLPRKVANREWIQPKRKELCCSQRSGR
ncbi:rCG20563 [Rattus norvegicus]|uniref:RCG20563 n=1 Tax=Rattus norvegicus TaxID=10116 RepID=A6K5N3_RAT|nr:rCG20563 [Rattus norvegicus]